LRTFCIVKDAVAASKTFNRTMLSTMTVRIRTLNIRTLCIVTDAIAASKMTFNKTNPSIMTVRIRTLSITMNKAHFT